MLTKSDSNRNNDNTSKNAHNHNDNHSNSGNNNGSKNINSDNSSNSGNTVDGWNDVSMHVWMAYGGVVQTFSGQLFPSLPQEQSTTDSGAPVADGMALYLVTSAV